MAREQDIEVKKHALLDDGTNIYLAPTSVRFECAMAGDLPEFKSYEDMTSSEKVAFDLRNGICSSDRKLVNQRLGS